MQLMLIHAWFETEETFFSLLPLYYNQNIIKKSSMTIIHYLETPKAEFIPQKYAYFYFITSILYSFSLLHYFSF